MKHLYNYFKQKKLPFFLQKQRAGRQNEFCLQSRFQWVEEEITRGYRNETCLNHFRNGAGRIKENDRGG
jgi:hypothetical protein